VISCARREKKKKIKDKRSEKKDLDAYRGRAYKITSFDFLVDIFRFQKTWSSVHHLQLKQQIDKRIYQ
jgi:hypothetical protein